MRKLASVCTISNIQKMFEKDRIVCVQMEENGYEIIVPSTYKVGDKIVFIQEGSMLPETETWEFLRKRCFNELLHKFIIRPMTMGKKEEKDSEGNAIAGTRVKSWGLAVGLDECGLDENTVKKLKSGDDLTEALGITKYEPEEESVTTSKKAYPKWVKFCLSHTITRWIGRLWMRKHQGHAGGFPTNVITKSDETSIQNMVHILSKYADSKVYTSVKIEGQTVTALFEYNEKKNKLESFYVCSRSNAYPVKNSSDFWTAAIRQDIENKLKDYYKKTGRLLVLQCEQAGPGIQSNIYNLSEIGWFVYTIKDRITGKQFPITEALEICKELGLKHVPIIDMNVTLKDIMPNIEKAVSYAENSYWKPTKDGIDFTYKPKESEKLWKDYLQNEGVVVRTMDYDKDSNVGVSFKVKNLQYAERSLSTIASDCKNIIE